MSKLLFKFIAIFFLILGLPAQASDGTDRGGGDEYVEQFQYYRHSVVQLVQVWLKDGSLKLSEVDQVKFYKTEPTLKVFSLDHVYLDPKDLKTEISILNEKLLSPPRITLGRARWKELRQQKPKEIEIMVLHELLSACGIADSNFETTFTRKWKLIEEWRLFRAEFQQRIFKMNRLVNDFFHEINLEAPKVFFNTIFLDSDVTNCLKYPGYYGKPRKYQVMYCDAFIKKWQTAAEPIVKKYLSEPSENFWTELNREKSEFSTWISSNSVHKDLIWYIWGNIVFGKFKDTVKPKQEDLYKSIKKVEFYNSYCEPPMLNPDYSQVVACQKDFFQNKLFQEVEPVVTSSRFEMLKALEEIQAQVDLQIEDPTLESPAVLEERKKWDK